MLVHRPRVMRFGSFGVIGDDLYVPTVAPQERVHITQLLPRTPTGSAVEGLAAAGVFGPTMLSEDGAVTIERLIRVTTQLAKRHVAQLLLSGSAGAGRARFSATERSSGDRRNGRASLRRLRTWECDAAPGLADDA